MISVLLTTYNSAPYIKDSIYSILNQTYKEFEFVIIDDGSTDNTENIITGIRDSRIRYYKIEHVGRSKALNYGLKICNCDWVALIDADDIAHPNRLELQLLNDLKYNSIVIISSVYFYKNEILFRINVKDIKIPQDLILHQKFPNAVLYNRKYIIENGGYNENLAVAEDYELWLRLMNTSQFLVVDKVLMYYRKTPKSLSRKNEKLTELTIYNIQDTYYKCIEKNFKIFKNNEKNYYRGWREFFFGNPKLAKKYWFTNIQSLCDLRILMATFIISLPEKYIRQFKRNNVKLRMKFLLNKVIGRNKELERNFKETIKLLHEL